MKTVIMILMALAIATGTAYGQTADQVPPVPSEEQPEVLTRGPVNEAFAQPVNVEEESDFTVTTAPPPDIEETPPEDRPDGDQFAWIPGYWAWDSDRDEYIWVSGCWRAVPPGKYWVSGYWTEVNTGWRWVEGFWASVDDEEIEYLPAPPAVTYTPPEIEEPDKVWVPGCWYWYNGNYTYRSGYWIDAREDWVWVPSHYIWTPRGYVFVSGHWDYTLARRGVLFAPVYFPGHRYWRTRYSYSLSIVVDLGHFEFGFFTRPRYRHYYFGDYYDSFYIGLGIFPWFECVTRHTWYDPIYLHRRWSHRRHDPHWRQHERQEYARRRADKKLRPPRTYREMERRVRNMSESRRRKIEVASPMKRHIENNRTTFKFRKERPEDRKHISRNTRSINRYPNIRSKNDAPETNHKTLNNTRKDRRREPTTIERKKTDKKQLNKKEYPNLRRSDSSKAGVKDQAGTARSNHMESQSTLQHAKQREESNKAVRTYPNIGKKKTGSSQKSSRSRSDNGDKKTKKGSRDESDERGDSREKSKYKKIR